jgi:hypothetical protein
MEPLGLRRQLDDMAKVIGCDCVLLASSVPGRVRLRREGDEWEWHVHRAVPDAFAWLRTGEKHLAEIGFGGLGEKLTSVAMGAQPAPHSPETGRLYLFNDWGCLSMKLRERCGRIREGTHADSFMLNLQTKLPVELKTGGQTALVTHIGLVLLGSACIGTWDLGESYLVFLDFESGAAAGCGPKQWIDTVEMECTPFLGYLAEVNAHFERLSRLNRRAPCERLQLMSRMTLIERDAYRRSADRLTRLLDADLPVTIEALVQMASLWEEEEGSAQRCQQLIKGQGVKATPLT